MRRNGRGSGEAGEDGTAGLWAARSAVGLGELDGASSVELRLADLIAERVAVRLCGGPVAETSQLIDANEVARILGCERSWVYEHKAELRVIRLGGGARPRLRFERSRVEAVALGGDMAAEASTDGVPQRRPPRRRVARRSKVKLLEIKGNAG